MRRLHRGALSPTFPWRGAFIQLYNYRKALKVRILLPNRKYSFTTFLIFSHTAYTEITTNPAFRKRKCPAKSSWSQYDECNEGMLPGLHLSCILCDNSTEVHWARLHVCLCDPPVSKSLRCVSGEEIEGAGGMLQISPLGLWRKSIQHSRASTHTNRQ